MVESIGCCAKCGKKDINYGAIELQDESAYYPYTCNSCGCDGKEWYDLVYTETIADND